MPAMQPSTMWPSSLIAEAAASAEAAKQGFLGKALNPKNLSKIGPALLGWMIASQVSGGINEYEQQRLVREATRRQAGMVTPENLYLQAALPKAQAEESQARQALLSQLSGGIIGPSLPRGYRVIGG